MLFIRNIPEEVLLIFVCGKSSLLLDNVNIVYEYLKSCCAVRRKRIYNKRIS